MTFDALAVPDISTLPATYGTGAQSPFVRDICLGLFDSGLLIESDAAHTPPAKFAAAAIDRIWKRATASLQLFQWNLAMHEEDFGPWVDYKWTENDPHVCAVISTDKGPMSCESVFIGEAMYRLEGIKKGLGQSVLAVLYEALDYLPWSITIREALNFAEYFHWYYERDERGAYQNYLDCGGDPCSIEQFLADHDVLRRSDFFKVMPEWAASPKQVLSRRQIDRLARQDQFAARVITACDSILGVATNYGPFAPINNRHSMPDCADIGLIVCWSVDDPVYRMVDDYLQEIAESGEQVEATAVLQMPITGTALRDWMSQVQNSALLARSVEILLETIAGSGDRTAEEQRVAAAGGRTLVEVFA
jgi:PRTRC genetic system protein F